MDQMLDFPSWSLDLPNLTLLFISNLSFASGEASGGRKSASSSSDIRSGESFIEEEEKPLVLAMMAEERRGEKALADANRQKTKNTKTKFISILFFGSASSQCLCVVRRRSQENDGNYEKVDRRFFDGTWKAL